MKAMLRLVALLVLAALIAVTPGASPYAGNARGSDDPVEIAINGQRFAIPSDYIASLAHDTHGSVKRVSGFRTSQAVAAPQADRASKAS